MIVGYVLISTESTYEREVARKLSDLEEVIDVEPLLVEETALADPFFEEYDLIAKIKADTRSDLQKIIDEKIHTIDGIEKIKFVSRTKTKAS